MTKRAEEGLRATLRLLMLFCAFAVLLMYPPSGCAEHRRTRWNSRAQTRARHGCRSRFRQARDGLSKTPTLAEKRRGPINHRRVFARRRHRVAFLLVTFLWAKPKEK